MIFEVPRPFAPATRATCRIVVGVAVVVVIGGLVGGVVAPPLFAVAIAAALVGGVTYWVAFEFDRSVEIVADGRLRIAGWDGEREVQLRDYARVTVKAPDAVDIGATPLD
ncbi:MAG: hypothetical protein AAF548_06700 [Actinomycetota bacterium]